MPAFASIRSAGLQLVKAANEGRTVIDLFPREKISEDFRVLADAVVGTPRAAAAKLTLRGIFTRQKEPARAT